MSNEFFKTDYKIENLAASILQIQFTQLGILLVSRYRVHNELKSCLNRVFLFSLRPCLFTSNFLNIKKYFEKPPQIVGRYIEIRISLDKKEYQG